MEDEMALGVHSRESGARFVHEPVLADAWRMDLAVAAQSDEAARERLVTALQPLIRKVARAYGRTSVVNETELVQAGVMGVLRALERFDPELETPFWGYASWWVRQAMQQLVSELTGAVVLSDRAVRQLARVKQAHRTHLQEHGAEPAMDDLCAATGLGRVQIENLMVAQQRPRGLEERVAEDGDRRTFGEMVADPNAEDEYERLPLRLGAQQVPDLLDQLNEREQEILRARFGLDGDEHTLRELAGTMGVSAERVRQIEERALDKLRDVVAA
jgi:RNA polymerase sigma factor (sigma-70 family)